MNPGLSDPAHADPGQRPGLKGAGVGTTLAWAVYLASSWTWVIGMFFPVLLIRDFGLYGWIVFAVPNVLGAAAVGFVTFRDNPTTPGDTWKARHAGILRVFSLVTISFQIFGVGWLLGFLLTPVSVFAMFLIGWALASLQLRMKDAVTLRRSGVAVYVVSCITMALFFANEGYFAGPYPAFILDDLQVRDLLCLAPGIAFGFILCPHMDLTLQRVRDELPASKARLAFAVGFCVFFLVMIVFTSAYSGYLFSLMNGGGVLGVLGSAVGVHLVTQAFYTGSLHVDQVRFWPADRPAPFKLPHAVVVLLVALPAVAALPSLANVNTSMGMTVGEIVYRCFLGFYGLLFPLYAWAAMICRGWERPGPSRFTWSLVAGLAAVTLPFFAVGFLMRLHVWTLPAVSLMLVVPWLLRNVGKPATPATPALL